MLTVSTRDGVLARLELDRLALLHSASASDRELLLASCTVKPDPVLEEDPAPAPVNAAV